MPPSSPEPTAPVEPPQSCAGLTLTLCASQVLFSFPPLPAIPSLPSPIALAVPPRCGLCPLPTLCAPAEFRRARLPYHFARPTLRLRKSPTVTAPAVVLLACVPAEAAGVHCLDWTLFTPII